MQGLVLLALLGAASANVVSVEETVKNRCNSVAPEMHGIPLPLGKCSNMFYMCYGSDNKEIGAWELFDCDDSMKFDEVTGQCRPHNEVAGCAEVFGDEYEYEASSAVVETATKEAVEAKTSEQSIAAEPEPIKEEPADKVEGSVPLSPTETATISTEEMTAKPAVVKEEAEVVAQPEEKIVEPVAAEKPAEEKAPEVTTPTPVEQEPAKTPEATETTVRTPEMRRRRRNAEAVEEPKAVSEPEHHVVETISEEKSAESLALPAEPEIIQDESAEIESKTNETTPAEEAAHSSTETATISNEEINAIVKEESAKIVPEPEQKLVEPVSEEKPVENEKAPEVETPVEQEPAKTEETIEMTPVRTPGMRRRRSYGSTEPVEEAMVDAEPEQTVVEPTSEDKPAEEAPVVPAEPEPVQETVEIVDDSTTTEATTTEEVPQSSTETAAISEEPITAEPTTVVASSEAETPVEEETEAAVTEPEQELAEEVEPVAAEDEPSEEEVLLRSPEDETPVEQEAVEAISPSITH